MSDRSVIWVRDALVILFSLYVVFALTLAPWSNLKISEPIPDDCGNGCAPIVNFQRIIIITIQIHLLLNGNQFRLVIE